MKRKFQLSIFCIFTFIISGCATTTYTTSPEAVEAQKQLNEVDDKLKTSPNDPSLLWEKAVKQYELALRQGDQKGVEKSELLLEDLQKKFPENERITLVLYDIQYRLVTVGQFDRLDKAKKYYDALNPATQIRFAPPSLSMFWGRTTNQQILGDHLKSDEEFYAAMQKVLRQAIKENPKYDESYSLLSQVFLRQQKPQIALQIAKQALQKFPESFSLLKQTSYSYMDIAQSDQCAYDHQDDVKQAITYARRALKINPKDYDLRYDLIDIYQYTNPILALNEAKVLNRLEKSSRSNINLASILSIYGDKNAATKIINAENKTNDPVWRRVKSFLAFEENDYKTAEKNIRLTPTSNVYLYLAKGVFREVQGEKQAFSNYAKSAIKLAENDSWESNLLKFSAGNLDQSELSKTATTSCQKLELVFYSGFKDYAAGNKTLAKEKFEKVISMNLPGMSEHTFSKTLLKTL